MVTGAIGRYVLRSTHLPRIATNLPPQLAQDRFADCALSLTGYTRHMTGPVTQTSDATVEYCRRARQLRARFPRQPDRLHRALRELTPNPPESRSTLTSRASVTPVTRVTVCPAALLGVPADQEVVVRRFVDHVRVSLAANPLLTFDHRRQLLRVADRLGVGRFHANLVMAALLHENGTPQRTIIAEKPNLRAKSPFVLTAVVTQVVVIATVLAIWAWI